MTHSTVKCPKPAYHKEQKDFERAILSGLLRDYRKATCSTPTTHFHLNKTEKEMAHKMENLEVGMHVFSKGNKLK